MAKREASELIRDRIVDELIPRAEKLGRFKLVEALHNAVEVGEEKAMDHPAYWEGIQTFADNGIDLAENFHLKGVDTDGQNTK